MLEILIGPIASGKSTYARLRAQRGAVVVNDDAIVQAVHAGDYTLYGKHNKPIYKAAEMALAQAAMTLGHDVVIDRPNNTPQARRRFIGLAHAHDTPVLGVLFRREAPAVHARRRFDHDSRNLPLDFWVNVAKHHDAEHVLPSLAEGFHKFIGFHMDGEQMHLRDIEGDPAPEDTLVPTDMEQHT